MLEVVMALSQFTTVLWHCAGTIRSRHGSDYWATVPTNLFRCADGWAYINIVPVFWDPFAVFVDRPELLLDERFKTNDLRMTNRDALHEIIAEAMAPMTREEILTRAAECRIPCGVVLTLDDVLDDAHLASRDVWQIVEGLNGSAVRSPRPAWHIHGHPPPPLTLAAVEKSDG
jgi:crotonobetainyl-CoA:carnitine CoA-transferase CaiB-like acyl-CoA transferase